MGPSMAFFRDTYSMSVYIPITAGLGARQRGVLGR